MFLLSGHTCHCPENTVGDPYTTGCRPKGECPNGDVDCPPKSVCQSGQCINPCEKLSCGTNAICVVKNRIASCVCPPQYIPSIRGIHDGCLRVASKCNSDVDCGNEFCSYGQCRAVCRNNEDCSSGEKCLHQKCMIPCADHSQCSEEEACIEGMCILGCRSNRNCPSEQACINNKCQDPCQKEGSCGPNAICSCQDHRTICKCPAGFDGNPTPQQGCIRIPSLCLHNAECPMKHVCKQDQCVFSCQNNSACAVGERCSSQVCVKVCYSDSNCLHGEICQKGVCQPGCVVDNDCKPTQVCLQGQCKCSKGFIGTPQGCVDINECEANPCHSTAICKNQLGSYTCICGEGNVGDPYTDPGCAIPGQCRRDSQCADNLTCKKGKCEDPCESKQCGIQAVCNATKHKASCICPPGHLGDPNDTNLGCFKVECLKNNDCSETTFCDEQTNKCLSK